MRARWARQATNPMQQASLRPGSAWARGWSWIVQLHALAIGGAVVVALAAALADRGPGVLVTSELPSTMARTEER